MPTVPELELACDIRFHQHSGIFPMMGETEFASFCADIESNGLRKPITLFEDQILDGRNRMRAMRQIDPQFSPASAPRMFEEFSDDDPFEWVVSQNLHRRHLNETQRALIAARITLENPGVNRFKPGAGRNRMAAVLNVDPGTVCRARKALRTLSPNEIEEMENGSRRVSRRNPMVSMAVSREEYDLVKQLADREGKSMSGWVRERLMPVVQGELARLGTTQ